MADKFSTEERIAHFLRLAEDESATQAERDTASTQAERLMLKHGIDRATAQAQDRNQDEQIKTDSIFFGGAYGEARMQSAYQVAYVFGLRAYKSAARDFDGNNSHANREVAGFRLNLVGFESDLVDVMRLLRSLDVQSAVAMKEWAKSNKDSMYWMNAQQKTKAKQSFAMAFGIGAAARIKSEREEAVQEAGTGTALVLVDRKTRVDEYYNDLPNIRKTRGRGRSINANAYSAGRSAGYNANTGGGKAITSQRAIGR